MDTFELYANLVDSLHPPPSPIAISKISDGLVQRITAAIASGEIEANEIRQLTGLDKDHLLLKIDSHNAEIEDKLGRSQYVLGLDKFDYSHPLLADLHKEVRTLFANDVGSPFVIVNSRMWVTHANSEEQGPNSFHTDGFSPGHLKVMIYITPLNSECGYFEFINRSDVQKITQLPAGTAILFRNSDITHRGVPGKLTPRISIEITLMRAMMDYPQKWSGHFFGRHLHEPTIFYYLNESPDNSRPVHDEIDTQDPSRFRISRVNAGLKVNIGSGKRDWAGWTCFDELSHKGVTKILFDPKIILPIDNGSVSLFYSSHCFEHLSHETVERLFSEAHRSSARDAAFVLKLPDYDYFLTQFRAGLSTAMNGKGIESVIHTWAGKINDTFINRLAMMFCGYWNKAYGDHFTDSITMSKEAYHGPPILAEEELREIMASGSPNEIAKTLASKAMLDPEFSRFNHQSAWSREEMITFLSQNGFDIVSTVTPLIIHRFKSEIPDLDSMQSWSAYYLAKKRG